jgi:DNA-binding PadR family transcriptional regulator
MPRKTKERPEDYVPLAPRVLAVLIALSEGPLHGYALLKRLTDREELGARPGPTTLYRTLHELEDAGMVEQAEERPDPAVDDDRRRYYRLTRLGRVVLQAELARLDRVLAWARRASAQPQAGR